MEGIRDWDLETVADWRVARKEEAYPWAPTHGHPLYVCGFCPGHGFCRPVVIPNHPSDKPLDFLQSFEGNGEEEWL